MLEEIRLEREEEAQCMGMCISRKRCVMGVGILALRVRACGTLSIYRQFVLYRPHGRRTPRP